MKNLYGIDPVDAALYTTAHEYRDPITGLRGVAALAVRLNIKEGSAQNKINPTCAEHVVNLTEFQQILLHTHDMRPLHALCAKFKHSAVPLDMSDDVSDAALIELLSDVDIQKGEFMQALKKALADGQVHQDEYDRLLQEGMDVIRALLETFARLKHMIVSRDPRKDAPLARVK